MVRYLMDPEGDLRRLDRAIPQARSEYIAARQRLSALTRERGGLRNAIRLMRIGRQTRQQVVTIVKTRQRKNGPTSGEILEALNKTLAKPHSTTSLAYHLKRLVAEGRLTYRHRYVGGQTRIWSVVE